MKDEAELILDAKAQLGEGAFWDARKRVLYWVDITGDKLHLYDPATNRDRSIHVDSMPSTVVSRDSGGLVLGVKTGIAAFDPDSAKMQMLATPEKDTPNNRFNDGKCDPRGRLWAGTYPLQQAPGTAHLWRMDADLSVHKILDGVTCSNGIVWTADRKTMYYIDTRTRRVDAFDYDDETGNVANRRPAFAIPEDQGYPDGMTIDTEGRLWVAHWGGSQVSCNDPKTGKVLRRIALPVSQVTSCAFGGEKMDRLYITSARNGKENEELAGGLFVADVGAVGVAQSGFAG
jgi:sugar lactone lactonase YvrE